MNYAQITINEQKVGLKFGMTATRMFFEKMEHKVLMMGQTLNELGITYLLWYGYLNNCEVKQVDPTLTFEDFYDLVDSSQDGNEEISKALDVWAETQPVKKAVEAVEAKKKSIGKKSKD
jgi:hypothetical protein